SPGVIVLGYDGLPIKPKDPYAYVEATMQEPPSPDFIPKHESSGDDADDEEEDEGEDEEEEEHIAPADSVPPLAEVDRLLTIPTLPSSPLIPLSSPLPWIPSSPFLVASPLPTSPTSAGAPLGYGAAMIWLRSKSPSISYLLSLPPPIVLPRTRASMVMMRVVVPSTYILAPRSETPPSETPPSGIPPL
nr:hypothetical protein [Tanacetum cinerariifolium]